jgi:hypothetical protein
MFHLDYNKYSINATIPAIMWWENNVNDNDDDDDNNDNNNNLIKKLKMSTISFTLTENSLNIL